MAGVSVDGDVGGGRELDRLAGVVGGHLLLGRHVNQYWRNSPRRSDAGELMAEVYHELGFDPDKLAKIGFEHKAVQAVLLEQYAPGTVPFTQGLDDALRSAPASTNPTSLLDDLYHRGMFIKRTLGYASAEAGTSDSRPEAEIELKAKGLHRGLKLQEEIYIIQRFVSIKAEYRIHTFSDFVIPDLTFYRHKRDCPPLVEVLQANAFVQAVLDKLPLEIKQGTVLGWDVAYDVSSHYYIIEVNPSGNSIWDPGFHTSAFLHSPEAFARLLFFIEKQYHSSVNVDCAGGLDRTRQFIWWVAKSLELLHLLDTHSNGLATVPSVLPMEWIDIRLPVSCNVFQWALREFERMRSRTH